MLLSFFLTLSTFFRLFSTSFLTLLLFSLFFFLLKKYLFCFLGWDGLESPHVTRASFPSLQNESLFTNKTWHGPYIAGMTNWGKGESNQRERSRHLEGSCVNRSLRQRQEALGTIDYEFSEKLDSFSAPILGRESTLLPSYYSLNTYRSKCWCSTVCGDWQLPNRIHDRSRLACPGQEYRQSRAASSVASIRSVGRNPNAGREWPWAVVHRRQKSCRRCCLPFLQRHPILLPLPPPPSRSGRSVKVIKNLTEKEARF